jgi:hypothetical protein
MFGKEKKSEKTFDLWGVDMSENGLKAMKQMVNSEDWKNYFEPWFRSQIDFIRSKVDELKPEDLIGIQRELKWLKRLAEMRNDFNARKV